MPLSPESRGTLKSIVGVALVVGALGAILLASGVVSNPLATGPQTVVTDISGETTVTITYETEPDEVRQFEVTGISPKLSDQEGDWAYIPRSSLPPELERVADDHKAGVVTVGGRALVGNLTAATVRIDGQPVTVVAPAGMDVDPARKAYFLDEFLSPYSFDPESTDRVTLVIAPSTLPSAGMMYGNSGYIAQTAFWDGTAGSVWVHEYVHSQQSFAVAPEMRWFGEASATYLSYRVMEEQYEAVSDEDVQSRLAAHGDYPDTILANDEDWRGTRADYYRGAKLLYVVDAEVREGSDGEQTLVDVYRAMNRHEGPITVDDFVGIVEEASGEDGEWLREAITTDGDLNRSVDRASAEFER